MQLTQEQTKALRHYLEDYRKAQTVEDGGETIAESSQPADVPNEFSEGANIKKVEA